MSETESSPVHRAGGEGGSVGRSIGARVRRAREALGWSPEDLAGRLGVDPCDIESYECGEKRIAAERLLELGDVLGVEPGRLFGVPANVRRGVDVDKRSWARAGVYLTLPEQGVRLNKAFVAIQDPSVREAIITLVADLARSETPR